MRTLRPLALLLFACSPSTITGASVDMAAPDLAPPDLAPRCVPSDCGPGQRCEGGACASDCRHGDANACASGTVCDFTDGKCRPAASACLLQGAFEDCGNGRKCGPGSACHGGTCIAWTSGCTGVDCDGSGRCWGTQCPCDRPAPSCTPAPLDQLNRADFVGSLANDRDSEGAFDLDFDEICTAYTVTMISGPDYLRQMTPDGKLTQWTGTTNLNMGEVAVLRLAVGEFGTIGDIAGTYICCSTCGCQITGMDQRLGVVHLDRMSQTRPLPNVIPAMPTDGTGPFGDKTIDTGPYGLTWDSDGALYVGNVDMNGDFQRVDLKTLKISKLAQLPARVVATAVWDPRRLVVGTTGGKLYLVETATGKTAPLATLAGDPTSLSRDRYTGRLYAEIRTTPPQIVSIDGAGQISPFQNAPRLGRIAIAPDGYLYHLSVYPAVQWKAKSAIVRWPLPVKR